MRFNLSVLKRNFAIIVWLMSILVRSIKSAIQRPCFFNSHQTFSFDFQGWRKNYNEWKTSEYFPFISSRLVWDKQTHKKKLAWLLRNNYFHFRFFFLPSIRCLTAGKVFSVDYSLSLSIEDRSLCHLRSLRCFTLISQQKKYFPIRQGIRSSIFSSTVILTLVRFYLFLFLFSNNHLFLRNQLNEVYILRD